MRLLLVCLLVLCVAFSVDAQQDSCPVIVDTALTILDTFCSDTKRNEACYGHGLISVFPYDDDFLPAFEERGDIVDVPSIERFVLSPMDLEASFWGVSLMRIQANLPDTLPGQNVTFLLLGDTLLENEYPLMTTVEVTALSNLNIRAQPTTSARNIIGGLNAGQTILATGILEDDSWVRVRYGDRAQTGWISAELLVGDFDALFVVSSDEAFFAPMQAFYLKSGIGDSLCAEAPESGLLIQTPQGVGRVLLNANGADIQMGSTAFLQRDDDYLYIYMLEGDAEITVDGRVILLSAGFAIRIIVDDEGYVTTLTEEPEPFDVERFSNLPLELLPRLIDLPDSLVVDSGESLTTFVTPLALPSLGRWLVTAQASGTCRSASVEISALSAMVNLSSSVDGATLTGIGAVDSVTFNWVLQGTPKSLTVSLSDSHTVMLNRVGNGVYTGQYDYNHILLGATTHTITVTLANATNATIAHTGTITSGIFTGCVATTIGSGTFQN